MVPFDHDANRLKNCDLVEQLPIVFGYSGTHGTAAAEFSEDIRNGAEDLANRIL